MSTPAPISMRAEIIAGPSADRLVDAFKYAYAALEADRMTVEFTLNAARRRVRVIVTSLRYENSEEGALLIEGHLPNGDTIVGSYDAKRRHGHLEIKH